MDPDVIYFDDFTDPRTGWGTGDEDGIAHGYTPQGYRVHVHEADRWWETGAGLELQNFSAEVHWRRVAGPADGAFGLVCRLNPEGAYTFQVDGEGYFGIYKDWYGTSGLADEFETLAEGHDPRWLNSDPATVYELRAVCAGPQLALFIDGRKVLEATDTEYAEGDVGLLAASGHTGRAGLEVIFNHFVVRDLPAA